MGNQMCKCFSSSDNTLRNSIDRRKAKNKREPEDEKIMVRSSSCFSNYEKISNLSSFVGKKLPSKTIENNKYFHMFPDNSDLHEIQRNGKFKVLPQDFERVEQIISEELEEAKINMDQYLDMLENFDSSSKKEPQLLIEIISGHDIACSKSRPSPFVEIIQNIESMPQR